MPGPGDYRPDPTEGITSIDDLPRPNVSVRSRNYRRRPCPRCGHSSYRDRTARRALYYLDMTDDDELDMGIARLAAQLREPPDRKPAAT